ncbi:hypothetical protein [Paludisphaera sp.]|uniref:hypothetical protein n=1 Tax=Paludisphaera sp. TaxID=2017432 RepID=UPI00301E55B6
MRLKLALIVTMAIGWGASAPGQEPVGAIDLRGAGGPRFLAPLHDVGPLEATPEGVRVTITGPDPYFRGPTVDLPEGVELTATVRVKSDQPGMLQLFHMKAGEAPDEGRSARAPVRAGEWRDVSVRLPALGPGTTFRVDPPGTSGTCVIQSIRFDSRPNIAANFAPPGVPNPPAGSPEIRSGSLALRQDPASFGGFALEIDGRTFAVGLDRPAIAYRAVVDGKPVVKWIDPAPAGRVESGGEGGRLWTALEFRDEDGATWRLTQKFAPHSPGVIAFEAECSVDAPRAIYHVPLLAVLPGHGQPPFGAVKGQAILAGVEYLDDEPSSSTADLGERDALRKVPSAYKLTFPLMAVQARGKYLGVIWDRSPQVAAMFDSPDRTLGSSGHLMGLIAPGANGDDRNEGSLVPETPTEIRPGAPLKATGMLIAGEGTSVIPAVQKYVELKGLPPIPETPGLKEYVKLAAAGWLDSPIREGARYRHAVGGGSFSPNLAADAAWMMDQLAGLTDDAELAARLRGASAEAGAAVPERLLLRAAVGHNTYPVAPLVWGDGGAGDVVLRSLERAVEDAADSRRMFEPDGTRRYRNRRGATLDYGRTHFSDEASGYAAQPVDAMLRKAAYSGDRAAVDEGLRLLAILRDRFRDGVPRGAQTWEIALHTPDVLGSAYLVRAFTLGYELTGDASFLEVARYWAWTGVPFVYLVNPTDETGPGAVGPYATIPVLGSTNWVAPNWIGLPVQWCGLVYADALIELDRHDPEGPWSRLADGIAASGILQVYPMGHPHQGLLPDSFTLREQVRNPADINPGTLQPGALRLLAGTDSRPYQFRALRSSGLWVTAPGSVRVESDAPGEAVLTVTPWRSGPSLMVVHNVPEDPAATADPAPIARRPGSWVLPLDGPAPRRITIAAPK